MSEFPHDEITRVVSAQGGYGKGIKPNPYAELCAEWTRRKANRDLRAMLTDKIESLFEPRFITPPETAELIEALVTASDSRQILELGVCTGFTSLHILRAIAGKPGAKLVSVDARPAHDVEFFSKPEITQHFEFVEGWTPQVIGEKLAGRIFDLVFIDSDHTPEHCEQERLALMTVTRPGSIWLLHDLPEWQTPDNRETTAIRRWIDGQVASGFLAGFPFPTCEQADCAMNWGAGYPRQCNPNLGIYVRLT